MNRLIMISSVMMFLLTIPEASMAQWYRQTFPSSEVLWKVRFVNPSTGWILGHRFVYKTTDGGLTWIGQDSSLAAGTALRVVDEATAFYATSTGIPPYTRGLRRTIDGGSTWQTVDTLKYLCSEIIFVDASTGYAGGGSLPTVHPMVRKTTDGGASWFTTWTGTSGYEIEGMHFFNADHGWAVTYDAILYETIDGGINWMPRDTINVAGFGILPLRDITFASPDSGWAVGGISSLTGGAMLVARTTDGGNQWTTETRSGSGSSLREVQSIDTKTVWFAGANNDTPFVARSTDGGETWVTQHQIPFSISGMESFSMISADLGWSVNNFAEVYKTTNGGTTFAPETGERWPIRLALSQNYPNPFNHMTTIDYRVGSTGFVSLKIYDVLGREVATLVDEELKPGSYKTTWDAAAMPSGVYFYLLSSNRNVDTKKLMLLK
jgi:photosystem II stability/assembly factor-like uncharacterized protein